MATPRPPLYPPGVKCFAAITPGLEPALVDELGDLGLRAREEPGGASFTTDARGLALVHMHCRVASRVTVEIGAARVKNLDGLAARMREQPWKKYVWPGQPIEVSASLKGSRLRHRESVQKKAQNAVKDALRGPRLPGPKAPRVPAKLIVRIHDDRAIFAVDATGELLHRRGWRKATAKAPIRENLAAAILRLADWDPGEALVDGMCGSGTFVIEAATICEGLAPGAHRDFAFERWPCTEAAVVAKVRKAARKPAALDSSSAILGGDRDPGAITASRTNARRAGVERRIQLVQSELAELDAPAPRGLVVLNPPYGRRIGKASAIGPFFRDVGRALKNHFAGWRLAILLTAPRHTGALGMSGLEPVVSFKNGGIPVTLYTGVIS